MTPSPPPLNESSSSSSNSMTLMSTTNEGGRVKQTRRRQRLSCVECTKRRQKCDRQFPCGLCTTRGIPHLCRWEPIVARPQPQRPPAHATTPSADATITTLTARIAALEQALLKQATAGHSKDRQTEDIVADIIRSRNSSSQRTEDTPATSVNDHHQPPSTSTATSASSESELLRDETYGIGEQGPRALIDYNVQVAAVALAQLSLAPRTEYIGNGTVLCALHKLGDPESWRFPYPASSLTSPVTSSNNDNTSYCSQSWSGPEGSAPLRASYKSPGSPIYFLVSRIPPRAHVEELLTAFFTERNWQFGMSERWFRSACQKMWTHLDMRCTSRCRSLGGQGGCPACQEEINPHWLSLLFAVLALAPSPRNKECAAYFMHALSARRLVEDFLLASPVYSTSEGAVDGAVLSCIAAAFLAMYLVDRGRVSEAWKMLGSGLRNAQALGMHRDPGWVKWEAMHKVERELRVTGWWLLMLADRLWSFVLGRPPMVPKGTYDVRADISSKHADGSHNPSATYFKAFIALSELIGDAACRCLGIHTPPYATILETDRKFQEWEEQLPESLRWTQPCKPSRQQTDDYLHPTAVAERFVAYQRHTLAAWYLGALMNIHRPYLMHTPPILPPPGAAAATKHMLNPSRERCIEVAVTLTRVMCTFYDHLVYLPKPFRHNCGTFTYFIFDGAVACAGTLSQDPPHPKKDECLRLMDNAIAVLQEIADAAEGATDGQGEMARRGIVVLKALKKAAGWDMTDDEKGELVLLQDMLKQQRDRRRFQIPNERASTVPHSNSQQEWGTPTNMATDVDYSAMSSDSSLYAPLSRPASGGANTSTFIPYLSSSTTSASTSPPYSNSSSSPDPPQFLPISTLPPGDLSLSDPWNFTLVGQRPPVQSMVIPFDVLQGVQPDSRDSTEFDLNWAKLAGMESWFTGQSGSNFDNGS